MDDLISAKYGYFLKCSNSSKSIIEIEPGNSRGLLFRSGKLDAYLGVEKTALFISVLLFDTSVFTQNQYFFDESYTRLPDTTVFGYDADVGYIDNDGDGDGDPDFYFSCFGNDRQKLYIYQGTPDAVAPKIMANTVYSGELDTDRYYPVRISARDNISRNIGELNGRLYYKANNSQYTQMALHPSGGTIFGELIPGHAPGSHIEYYYEMIDRKGNTACMPPEAPDSIYRFTINDYTGLDNSGIVPSKFKFKAYPNPFNSVLTLNISGLEGGDAEIGIYDIQGRLLRSFQLENHKEVIKKRSGTPRTTPDEEYLQESTSPGLGRPRFKNALY